MGQKVSPHGLRVGVIKDWNSKWYAGKEEFAEFLAEDNKVRTFVKKALYGAGISRILLERPAAGKLKIIVLTARPGMVIGRSGAGIDELKVKLERLTGKEIIISIEEVRKVELDAQLTAESIAEALEHRVSFRRAMKQAMGRTMRSDAKGIKILCSGRLNGAEIARSEKYSEGNVPLHTLRADIDYGFAEADTTYGKIGVKVWINHGEILDKGLQNPVREEKRERRGKRSRRDGDNRRRNDRRRNDRGGRQEAARPVSPRIRKTREVPKTEPAPEAVQEAQTSETSSEAAEE